MRFGPAKITANPVRTNVLRGVWMAAYVFHKQTITALINTPLQRGACRSKRGRNRFNGFDVVPENAETVAEVWGDRCAEPSGCATKRAFVPFVCFCSIELFGLKRGV